MDRSPRIVGIGIAVVDIYRHHKRMYPGGNEYNVAYHAKLQGADAAFMGVFADDKAGEILEQTLNNAGIDTSHSHHEKGSSGYAIVDLVEGDRVFVDWNRQGVTDLYPFTFTEEEIEYIVGRFARVRENYGTIDALLAEATSGWKLSRMGKVELSLLRLAVFEMNCDEEIPGKVAINEAVELAKKFGGDASYGFVNGVLAKLARE